MCSLTDLQPAVARVVVCLAATVVAVVALPALGQTIKPISAIPVTAKGFADSIDEAGNTVAGISRVAGGPTNSVSQVTVWTAPSWTPTQITNLTDDASSVNVSNDGQFLTFVAESDPLGTNHDRSAELFGINVDGTGLIQLTDEPGFNAGEVSEAKICGDGTCAVFTAGFDPLGTNPLLLRQLFRIETDGTNLSQLTTLTETPSDRELRFDVDDSGQRVVFDSRRDLTGGNPDEDDSQVFLLDLSSSLLTQLTPVWPSTFYSNPTINAYGTMVAFEVSSNSGLGIQTIRWNGTNHSGVGAGTGPTLTADGLTVYYSSQVGAGGANLIRRDSRGLTPEVEITTAPTEDEHPILSRSGNRLVFQAEGEYPGATNTDGGWESLVIDVNGSNAVQLTDTEPEVVQRRASSISADAGTLVSLRQGPTTHSFDAFVTDGDGSNLTQVADLTYLSFNGVTADGQFIVFSRQDASDPVCDLSQIFRVRRDGTDLTRLSSLTTCQGDYAPSVSDDGSVVVYSTAFTIAPGWSVADALISVPLAGGSSTGIDPGHDVHFGDFLSKRPQIDATGTWVVYQSSLFATEIFRARVDGSVVEQITDDPDADAAWPDQSGDGTKIVYSSDADPLGSNPEGNQEIFLFDPVSSTTTQLTQTPAGESYAPMISSDGSFVYFNSDADFFEPNTPLQQFRIDLGNGVVERAGGLENRTYSDGSSWLEYELDCDTFGSICYGTNYLLNYNNPARIAVGAGSPTLLTWDEEPKPIRYDVIRGDVAGLSSPGGGVIDLGTVVCLENDSPDTNTVGFEDTLQPTSGQALFYLYRGSQGVNDTTATWGVSSSGDERVAPAGDCAYP